MANTTTNLIPLMSVNVLDVMRENAVTPRLVTNSYGTEVAQKGDRIPLNVMNDFEASDVTPGVAIPAAGNDITPEATDLRLNLWKKSNFQLTDKEMAEIVETGRMKALDSAVRAVVNAIDKSVLGLYTKVSNFAGTAGTTPFGSNTGVLATANRLLSTGLAPKENRSLIVDEFAYSNATQLSVLQAVDSSGLSETLRDARVTRAVGYNWAENQNVLAHTTTATGNYAIDANASAGATSIVVDNAAGATPTALVVGDLLTIAGNTTQYVVTSYTANANDATVGISPALAADVTDGVVVTVVASHTANLAFHPEAFHLAVRPTSSVMPGAQVYQRQTIADPVSGLALTLMIFEAYHQTLVEVSALYGVACPRPGFACRILG